MTVLRHVRRYIVLALVAWFLALFGGLGVIALIGIPLGLADELLLHVGLFAWIVHHLTSTRLDFIYFAVFAGVPVVAYLAADNAFWRLVDYIAKEEREESK